MAADRVNQLDQISEQLGTLIGAKSGISKPSFWAGILLTIISMIVTASLSFGSLQSDLENHIGPNGANLHLSSGQQQEMVLNTQHSTEYTRKNLDAIYVSHEEIDGIVIEIENQEKAK